MSLTTILSGKAGRIKRLISLCVTLLLAAQTASPVAGQEQAGAPPAPKAEKTRVLLQTSSGSVVTTSAQQPAPRTRAALTSLLSRYPGTWKVDIERSFVKRLRPLTHVDLKTSPQAFGSELLSEFSDLFGVTAQETSHVADYPLKGRAVVEYRQTLNGIPVEHSFVTVSTVSSRLEQISSRLYPAAGGLGSMVQAFSRQEASDIAAADLREQSAAGNITLSSESELIVLPLGESLFLTWKVIISAQERLLSYTYYVDAETGQVLKKYSNIHGQQKGSPQAQDVEVRQVTGATLKRRPEPAAPAGAAAAVGEAEGGKSSAGPEVAAPPVQLAGAWEHVLSENFDVRLFPYSPWSVFDDNGATGGVLHWDDQNCVSNDPSWSLWAAAGGANGLNACVDNYAHNMNSWAIYGPFSLSNAADGLLDFHFRNESELNFDFFKWMVSVDGTNFHGFQTSGSANTWRYASLDFKNVPTLGNILGRPSVWVAFNFTSDGSIVSGKGPFVDSVAVKRLVNNTCTGVSGHVGGHIYGRNKFELQLSNFKNMKVVLDRSLATDSHAVTDASGNYSSAECSDRVRFELEGFGSRNFVRVKDCNNGNCFLGGDVLRSPDLNFAPVVGFNWNEADDNKKEVNVFWHLNEIHDWFKNLVGQDLMNYQMQAHVDYVDNSLCVPGAINAFYRSDNDNIYFCPSDVSRESDVIYHEYGHGIVDHISNYFLPYEDEGGAINEGVADYFAAARNGDPSIGEGVGALRTITNVVNYSNRCSPETSFCSSGQYHTRATPPSRDNDFGYVHHNSLVPSGALWNLRQSQGLSQSFVDNLVIDTLILHKPLTVPELLESLVAQDGGAHQNQIRAAFASRGVGQTATIEVTVQASPAGRSFTVDNTTYNSTQTFAWVPGSSHTIGTAGTQAGGAGTRYVWGGWSDGGAISHAVAPTANTTYTATFTTQHFLTMNAGSGGSVSPASGWRNSGQSVGISAAPNAGSTFGGWTGSGTGSFTGATNPASVIMSGPVTQTATFVSGPPPPPPPTTRRNVAAAANGATASAWTTLNAGLTPLAAINGDRKGLHWGSDPATGSGWHDAGLNSYPDMLQINFAGTRTINEVVVYSLQDAYRTPSEPTDAMTFTRYGLVDFEVQYWTGAAWARVPNGLVARNNRVKRTVMFRPLSTSRIRLLVTNGGGGHSRVIEVEAFEVGANVALATAGAVASASSSMDAGRGPGGAVNGDWKGLNWGRGGGWHDATNSAYPDWLQVDFNGAKTISEIDVYTIQDSYATPVDPADTLTFLRYGIVAYDVQYWNGAAWVTVPGGSVASNNRVWRRFTFPAVTTSRIRVLVRGALGGHSRVVEVEAYQ